MTRYGASRRTRHNELRYVYTQSLVTVGLLRIAKVPGAQKVADLGTQYLDRTTLGRLREMVGVQPSLQVYDMVQAVVLR